MLFGAAEVAVVAVVAVLAVAARLGVAAVAALGAAAAARAGEGAAGAKFHDLAINTRKPVRAAPPAQDRFDVGTKTARRSHTG